MVLYSVRQKIEHALAKSEYMGMLLCSPGSVMYILGGGLPFLNTFKDWPVSLFFSKNSAPVCIIPWFLKEIIYKRGWYGSAVIYSQKESLSRGWVKRAAGVINSYLSTGGNLGLEMDSISVSDFESLTNSIENSFLDCSEWVRELREVKTAEEIERLCHVAYRTDHGIAGAIHHVSAFNEVSEKYLSEDIRVHSSERGCDVQGYQAVSQVASGRNTEMLWAIPPRFCTGWDKRLERGDLIRCEMRGSYKGYFSDAGRILLKGDVPESTKEAYLKAEHLINWAVNAIKPGVNAANVYRDLLGQAESIGAELYPGLGIGHGIGVSTSELPYLNGASMSELKENMVLVLDIILQYGEEQWLRLKETLVIGQEENLLPGRYLNWENGYTAAWTF